MKAVRAHEWCGPEGLRLDDIDPPKPRRGEALIKVAAAALNFPDRLMIEGKYQSKPAHPFIPGMELSGVVESLGEGISKFQPGDRVMAQTGLGAFAEYVAVPFSELQSVPASMPDDEAAVFPLVYQTSYFGLAVRGQLKPGETVLVHSAAGGVGLAAVQIARAMGAGKVIGTAGSDEKLPLILKNRADVAINYEKEDFVEIVKRETGGRGADVIYEPVGGEIAERSTKCISFGGRIVIVGFTSGKFTDFKSNHMLVKNYSVVGLHWGAYKKHQPELIESAWRDLLGMYERGLLKPVVDARYPMSEIAKAMEYLASRKAVGKIVLHW